MLACLCAHACARVCVCLCFFVFNHFQMVVLMQYMALQMTEGGCGIGKLEVVISLDL